MNIDHEVLCCPVCGRKMEYLDFEKTIVPIVKELAPVGVNKTMKCVNIHLYCQHCRVNQSKPFPYNDEKFIKPFIEDVSRHSAHFDKLEYMDVA